MSEVKDQKGPLILGGSGITGLVAAAVLMGNKVDEAMGKIDDAMREVRAATTRMVESDFAQTLAVDRLTNRVEQNTGAISEMAEATRDRWTKTDERVQNQLIEALNPGFVMPDVE